MTKLEDIEQALEIKPLKVERMLTNFIQKKVEEAGVDGVVLGLSGGVDSSTVAFLCAEVLGGEKVLALSMPEEGTTNPQERKDARDVAEELGLDFRVLEISPILEKFEEIEDFDEESRLPAANLRPRVRMTLLYYYANLLDRLVVGTSNRSEIRSGYFTKYGDGASDFEPLGCLYKTQVLELAKHLEVPEPIIRRPPSAGLWRGQTDESELGISYEQLDRIYIGFDLGLDHESTAKAVGVKEIDVKGIEKREKQTRHKLVGAEIPEL